MNGIVSLTGALRWRQRLMLRPRRLPVSSIAREFEAAPNGAIGVPDHQSHGYLRTELRHASFEKTPPRLDGVKFGRERHEITNAPPDRSCHDSGLFGMAGIML